MGFALRSVAVGDDGGKKGRPVEVVEETPGMGDGFVGDEGEWEAVGVEGAKAFVHPWKGVGGVGEVFP